MAKTEFEINEVFQLGLTKVKCVKQQAHYPFLCLGCCINSNNCPSFDGNDFVGHCAADKRKDKTNVIFIRVEE